MAHIHHLGDQAPAARPFIHLGATSAYVTDNADLVLMREAMQLLLGRIGALLVAMGKVARRYRALPCVAYTHFQPAQLTTVGKRMTLWMQDFALDAEELLNRITTLRFRGVKGTTGTQASFLELFDGDDAKVRELDVRVSRQMGFPEVFAVTGQTYTRKLDAQTLACLAGVAQSAAKFATDLRLLQHEGELLEPFESEQVGSSAMPYKRNPMRAERITSLARFVIELEGNAWHTAAAQWLERTLDDSANRRLVIPEAFLATDAILVLAINVAAGLEVREETITQHVAKAMPFLATERLLMRGVKAGGDRQQLHEVILSRVPALAPQRDELRGRAMLTRRATTVPFECIARGYISASAWAEYQRSGTLAGEPMPQGLVESVQLDPPIFSPATKAEQGHDENVTFDRVVNAVGRLTAERLRGASLALYEAGRDYAAKRGIIIADTKFEFGTTAQGELIVIDEILTPDSSRFWPADPYQPGRSQPRFDKQPLRDDLADLKKRGKWNGEAPPPSLPPEVVTATSERYRDAYRRITGTDLE